MGLFNWRWDDRNSEGRFKRHYLPTRWPLPIIFVESDQEIGTALDHIFKDNYRGARISVRVPGRFLYKLELLDKPYPEQVEQVRGMSKDMIVL